ncbi:MAG: matrixin family metalloprotease [Dehalococcoidia bacterium]|nr:matrixin family metalloprotease [Dehalococcoidia bacterium]
MRQPGRRDARRSWAAIAAIMAFFVTGWSLGAWMIFGGSSGADAEPELAYREVHSRMAVPFGGEWYTVDVQFFMHDDGSGRFAAAANVARAEMLARFPGAVEIRPGEVAAAYLNQGYWWPNRTVTWGYNGAGKPAGLADEYDAIARAANSWNVSGANFRFNASGATSAGTGGCSGSGLDGFNTVGWGRQSGAVLAVTCSWYALDGTPKTATEFDMQIDPDWEWTTGSSPEIDVESVILHEFGHAIGLGHSGDGNAVMYASYCAGCSKRDLQPDDIAGAKAIYGTAAAPTPVKTATPTPVPPTATPTPVKTATPAVTPSKTATPPATATPKPTLPLMPGANLLAWPGASQPAAQAFGQQPGLSVVYSWNPATQSWTRYIPGVPAYVSNLKTVETGQVYWFIASTGGVLPFSR